MPYDLALARVLLSREHGDGGFEERLSPLGTSAYSNPQRAWGKILTLAGAADVELYTPYYADGVRVHAQAPVPGVGDTNIAVVTRAISPLPNGAVVRGRGVFTTDAGSTGNFERKFRVIEGATGAEVTGLLVNLTNSLTNSAQTFGPTTLSAAIRQPHMELKALAGNAVPTETVRVRADELLVEEVLDLTNYQAGELSDTLQMLSEVFLLRKAGTAAKFQGMAQRTFRLPVIIEKANVATRNRLLQLWGRIDGDPLRLYVSSDDRYLPVEPLPATIEQLGGGAERITLEFALQHGWGSISRLRQGVNLDPFGSPPARLAVTSPTIRRDIPCDIIVRYSAGASANDTVTVQRAGGGRAKFTIPSGGISGENIILFEGRTGKLWRRTLTARTDVSSWLDPTSQFPRLAPGENEILIDSTGTAPAQASVGFYEVTGEPDY